MSNEGYLIKMPLKKVHEIHITRPGWQGAQRVDLHQPLLGWVLERAPVEAVTLEVEELSADSYHEQVQMMHNFLEGR